MITASLPMYDREEVREAHQEYWRVIRAEMMARGVECPRLLTHPQDLIGHWESPGLVLSQTCGMPYRLWLHDRVTLVGTPDYAVTDCEPGYYRSAIVVRADDSRMQLADYEHAVFAYNQLHSQSGFAAAYHRCKPLGFWFANTIETGAHVSSVAAVISGAADIASIDAVTWQLLLRHESAIERVRVLDWTAPTPGLPYIASLTADASATFDAVTAAIATLPDTVRDSLQIKGLVSLSREDYLAVPNPDICL